MRIPDESNLVQEANSFIRESGSLPINFEFVLVALALDPLGQRGIPLIVMWNMTMAVEPAKFA